MNQVGFMKEILSKQFMAGSRDGPVSVPGASMAAWIMDVIGAAR